MITDKLLAFADGKALTFSSGAATSDVIDLGKGGDEIARTLNLVAQVDEFGTSPTTSNTIAATLQGYDGSSWDDVVAFPAVTIANLQAGKRLVEFAKLPLGLAKYSKLRISLACATSGSSAGSVPSGTTYSAWLTPSAELA